MGSVGIGLVGIDTGRLVGKKLVVGSNPAEDESALEKEYALEREYGGKLDVIADVLE